MSGAYAGRLACDRCGQVVGERDAFAGCPRCTGEGVGANVHPVYDLKAVRFPPAVGERGVFRWRELLPFATASPPLTLHEGDTPLVHAERLGAQLGVGRLYIKDESRNPTWSYKDRLAAVAVTKAVEVGMETVVVATTGNHGAAAAAYAAAAGLRCVALTLESVPTTMKTLMQVYGADVVALRSGPERWALMSAAVAERGWVPLSGFRSPPVGSNPFGIEGYKTIAYELWEALGAPPDVVVVPTAYADGMAGVYRGFADLVSLGVADRVPRLVAAEPLGAYVATLEAGGDATARVAVRSTPAFSTATPVATYQGLRALRASAGVARAVHDDRLILEAQGEAAKTAGLYLEASAALALPVIADLAGEGWIGTEETVVVLGTSSGLKDVGATASTLPAVPLIDPTLADLDRVLEAVSR